MDLQTNPTAVPSAIPSVLPSQIGESPQPTSAKSSATTNNLLAVAVNDENTALNMLVAFLNVAQKRGVYSFDESAKIWECIKFFIQTPPPAPEQPQVDAEVQAE
jgi:hypothetical protein